MTDHELESQLERIALKLEQTAKPESAKIVRAAAQRIVELRTARSLDDGGILGETGGEGLFSRLFGGSR